MMDCFYPAAAAQLGSYTFKQGVALTICSSDDSPSDWATVRFTRPLGDAVQLKRMDAAALYLGYSGSFTKVFEGLLAADFASSGSVREVRLRDAALRLALTPLNHSFAGATPQEVVRYCCRAAGIPSLEPPPPSTRSGSIRSSAGRLFRQSRESTTIGASPRPAICRMEFTAGGSRRRRPG